MVRKSGIDMATPRSIVDQVTARSECLETGVDFEPPGDRPISDRLASQNPPFGETTMQNYLANTSCSVSKAAPSVLAETLPIFFANRTLSTARI
jgi:hypothetical protein